MIKQTLLAALLPAVALAGCTGTKNRGVESVHQPMVDRADYVLDLTAAGDRLAPGERQRLVGWLTGLRLGYGDRVSIDDPAGSAPAAHDEVASVLARFGLLLAPQGPVSTVPLAPGAVRVIVSRMTASVPGCPDWSRDSSVDYEQHTSSNYGCATNVNLAAMVASPQDLIRGAGSDGVIDPAVSFKAIESFRKAQPSGAGGTAVKSETAGGK